ncbi:uncharacterized protein LOC130453274 [Diorhabda sublineata]|uniref:uncharacterized protein LOC130453274 n=1 Tax=Diorhabda sublineata TaxID=1163346 RepID=UPI0024E0F69B|nr:uncharacterized protein LOC130453274 [Diorhabda sublineata]
MKICLVLFLVLCVSCIALAEHKTSHSSVQGQGHENKGGHTSERKHGKYSGKSSKHDNEHVTKGEDFEDLHKKSSLEKGGKKSSHFDEDSYKSSHKSGGGSGHGLKYEEGNKHHKGNYLKGFREKYHKDESKKHDSFFSSGEKGGQYAIFGKKNSKYSSDSFSKKKGNNHKNSASAKSGGKAYKSGKTHHVSDSKGHQGQGGFEKHYKSGDTFGKKHSSHGGKKYKSHSV